MSPIAISAGFHIALVSVFALLLALGRGGRETIDLEVIERPVRAAPQLDLSAQKPPEPKPEVRARKVFGATRKSLEAENSEAGAEIKKGNTLATTPDNEKLKDSDADQLPIPADEYLISKMPAVSVSVNISYPPEARAKKIKGKVVLELLIDATGRVREARILSGPGFGLNEAALEAIKKFKFQPAEVNGKPVAVKIPFTYNFLLRSD